MSEEANTLMDNILTQGGETPSTGVPTPVVDTPVEDSASEPEAKLAEASADTHPEVINAAPTFLRRANEKVGVDDNFNLQYVLKNGKTLKISVVKPDLSVSTKISDMQIKFNETDTGERYMQVNNMGVYQMLMKEIIRVVLVDGAPMHGVTFDHLTQIGMTKGELDDVMGIINTFYLTE